MRLGLEPRMRFGCGRCVRSCEIPHILHTQELHAMKLTLSLTIRSRHLRPRSPSFLPYVTLPARALSTLPPDAHPAVAAHPPKMHTGGYRLRPGIRRRARYGRATRTCQRHDGDGAARQKPGIGVGALAAAAATAAARATAGGGRQPLPLHPASSRRRRRPRHQPSPHSPDNSRTNGVGRELHAQSRTARRRENAVQYSWVAVQRRWWQRVGVGLPSHGRRQRVGYGGHGAPPLLAKPIHAVVQPPVQQHTGTGEGGWTCTPNGWRPRRGEC